jgi:hypothetical protein
VSVLIDAAPAEPALYGILSSASVVTEDGSSEWIRGIDYETLGCSADIKLQAICVSTVSVTAIDGTGTEPYKHYLPFAVQTSFSCSTMGYKPEDVENIARGYIDSCTQKALETEFWTGRLAKAAQAQITPTPYDSYYLASASAIDVTPTPGTGVKAKYGLALLEKALGDCACGQRGTIHAPRDVASTLALKDKNGHLESPLGSYAIAGTGYTGSGPNGVIPTGGKAWMYATGGRVEVRLAPVTLTPEEPSQAVNTSVNTITYNVDRVAAISTASCCTFAVLVDLGLDYA